MKTTLLSFLLVLVLALAPLSARAQTEDAPSQKELTAYFSTYAKMFGCTKNNYNKDTSINVGQIQFMPENQKTWNWTKLFTVVTQTLPEKNSTLTSSAIHGYASKLLENYTRTTKIVEGKNFKAKDKTPVIYFEYRSKNGIMLGNGVGVYGRHTGTLAAFTRYEVRGRPLTQDEKDLMKKIAEMLINRESQ
ncbi:MAG: hypothetical protein AB7E52_04795 [Bdellovibrionales bacterium]